MLTTQVATRYVKPLREGGSLPAIVECDDGALRVLKFRAAGQGLPVLVAEVIAGELARRLGLKVPALAVVELDEAIGRAEPDPEIRDLLIRSAGTNLGMAYLPGAVGFDAAARAPVGGALASAIVCFDAYVTNVDRTAKNPNLMWWLSELWLIDHGAALFAQYAPDFLTRAASPFAMVKDHVLLPQADELGAAGAALAARLTDGLLREVVDLVPDGWLTSGPTRADYLTFLTARRDAAAEFLEEAGRARARLV
jgi:hypothetical protein